MTTQSTIVVEMSPDDIKTACALSADGLCPNGYVLDGVDLSASMEYGQMDNGPGSPVVSGARVRFRKAVAP